MVAILLLAYLGGCVTWGAPHGRRWLWGSRRARQQRGTACLTVGFDNNVLLMLAVYAMKLNAPFS